MYVSPNGRAATPLLTQLPAAVVRPPVDVPDAGLQADTTPLQALDEIAVDQPAAFAGPAHPNLQQRRVLVERTRTALELLRNALERGGAETMSPQEVETVRNAWEQACALDRDATGLDFMPATLACFVAFEPHEAYRGRQSLRGFIITGLEELLRSQTAQGFRPGRAANPWLDDATPDDVFAARSTLQSFAAGGPAQARLARQLLASWEQGHSRVHLAHGLDRKLPDVATIAALSTNVRLVHIDRLRKCEVDAAFIAGLMAFGAEALLLNARSEFVSGLAGAARNLYLARSPQMDLEGPEFQQAWEAHPGLHVWTDMTVKGAAWMAHHQPHRVEGRLAITGELLQDELDRPYRRTEGFAGQQIDAMQDATADERRVLNTMMKRCQHFVAGRPDFQANVELLLRHMADDPAFRAEACAQIDTWSPKCADDWICCISTVLSARNHAGPITDAPDGAKRMLWQSLQAEVDRIAFMRDPDSLPPGSWESKETILEVETALMLRQAVDAWMRERFDVSSARHVPQIYGAQSAVNETEAGDVVQRLVQSERESGFPMALALARDSDAWKTFVATLPEVEGALKAAHVQAMAALEARPQDGETIQADYLRQCDDIRARPLLEALDALFTDR
ncbi:hypothetical protein [Xylophilus sp. GOD-11R]|uniref:hypothetical protein n=1 Tax=Xylophilus sp. GOD-11R TaxID=3089814 RepID=UPI00298C847C|nr:hypothetical protein [Xylophilus sp. GOD-11R]WPB59056.1 hypothetical protein R9X41_10600 [Xylophilus sp. GOD-11R]